MIELTSFSKYQKPYWIIKMCPYWGTYFWQKEKTENRAALVELTQNEGLFHSPIFLQLRFFPSALTTVGA